MAALGLHRAEIRAWGRGWMDRLYPEGGGDEPWPSCGGKPWAGLVVAPFTALGWIQEDAQPSLVFLCDIVWCLPPVWWSKLLQMFSSPSVTRMVSHLSEMLGFSFMSCRLDSRGVVHVPWQDQDPFGDLFTTQLFEEETKGCLLCEWRNQFFMLKKGNKLFIQKPQLVKRGSSAVVLLVKSSMNSKNRCCLASAEVELSSHLFFSLLHHVGGPCLAWNKIHRIRKANFVDLCM